MESAAQTIDRIILDYEAAKRAAEDSARIARQAVERARAVLRALKGDGVEE